MADNIVGTESASEDNLSRPLLRKDSAYSLKRWREAEIPLSNGGGNDDDDDGVNGGDDDVASKSQNSGQMHSNTH